MKEVLSITTDVVILAYTAGIVDGEGCINLFKTGESKTQPPRYSMRVEVANSDEWVAQFLHLNFGGSVCLREPRRPTHSRSWVWSISTREAARFLAAILPYLRIKHPQAELAISYQSRKHYNSGHLTNEERVLAQADRILMSSLNKKGGK